MLVLRQVNKSITRNMFVSRMTWGRTFGNTKIKIVFFLFPGLDGHFACQGRVRIRPWHSFFQAVCDQMLGWSGGIADQSWPSTHEFESLKVVPSLVTQQLFVKQVVLFARQIRSGLSNSLSKVNVYQSVSRSGNSPLQIVIRNDLKSPLLFSSGLSVLFFRVDLY